VSFIVKQKGGHRLIEPIIYREMVSGEEQAVCDLVKQVFNEYVASDYGQKGIDEFFRFAHPGAMKERMQSGGFVLVAQQGDALAGMLEFYPPDCIAMLFVTVKRQGVATKLLALAISKLQTTNPDLEKLTVHSSPYAEPIYRKMGFKKTGGTITENSITYIPMELALADENN
jgi:hypothetical protein